MCIGSRALRKLLSFWNIIAFSIFILSDVILGIKTGIIIFLAQFISAILKLLNDSNLRDSMGHSGRELVIKEFSKEIIASQTMKVWNEAFE